MKHPEQANLQRQKADECLPGAAGEGDMGVTANGCGDFLLGQRKCSRMDWAVDCTALAIF